MTYDSFAGAWPDRETAGGDDATFAAQLGDVRKVVVTAARRTSAGATPSSCRATSSRPSTALKADPAVGKILVPGSVSVVRQLLAAGLLDELRLLVHPVAARKGERLFDEGEPIYPLHAAALGGLPDRRRAADLRAERAAGGRSTRTSPTRSRAQVIA